MAAVLAVEAMGAAAWVAPMVVATTAVPVHVVRSSCTRIARSSKMSAGFIGIL